MQFNKTIKYIPILIIFYFIESNCMQFLKAAKNASSTLQGKFRPSFFKQFSTIGVSKQEAYKILGLKNTFKVTPKNLNNIYNTLISVYKNKDEGQLKQIKAAKKFVEKHQKFIEEYYNFNDLNNEEINAINACAEKEYLIKFEKINEQIKKNRSKASQFFEAIKSKNSDKVKTLLEDARFNPNIMDSITSLTPLILAVSYDNIDTVKLLLNCKRFNLHNAVDILGRSAIHYCIKSQNLEITSLLFNDLQIDIDLKDQFKKPAMHYCNKFNEKYLFLTFVLLNKRNKNNTLNLEKSIMEIDYYIKAINPYENIENSTEKYATYKDIINKLILINNKLINEDLGKYFLFHAINNNDFELATTLLKLGANVNCYIEFSSKFKAPIFFFAKNILMSRLIKKYKANLELKAEYDLNQISLLHQIIKSEYDPELINEYLPYFDEIPVDSYADTPWDILNSYSNQAPSQKMELFYKVAKESWDNNHISE